MHATSTAKNELSIQTKDEAMDGELQQQLTSVMRNNLF